MDAVRPIMAHYPICNKKIDGKYLRANTGGVVLVQMVRLELCYLLRISTVSNLIMCDESESSSREIQSIENGEWSFIKVKGIFFFGLRCRVEFSR